MFGQNILRPLKEYGHSYGSNANPELSANVHKNCGAADRTQLRQVAHRLEEALMLLKKAELMKLCMQFSLPFNGRDTKRDLRQRILNS